MGVSTPRSRRTYERRKVESAAASIAAMEKARESIDPALADFVAKCRASPRYFITRCLSIIPREGGEIVPFIPNYGQDLVLDEVERQIAANQPVRVIILKSRRWGISTLGEALVYWKTSNFDNVNGIVVAHKKQNTQEIFRIAKTFYDHDERHKLGIAPEVLASNELAIRFDTDRKQKSLGRRGLNSHLMLETAEGSGVATGTTIQAAHLSETSKWPRPEIMAGVGIALSKTPGSIGVIESTAEGYDLIFQKAWANAAEGKGGWVPIFLPWQLDPNNRIELARGEAANWDFRDPTERELHEKHKVPLECLKWRRMMLASPDLIRSGYTPEQVFRQEFPTTPEEAFLTSGQSFFLPEYVTALEKSGKGPREPLFAARIPHEGVPADRAKTDYSPLICRPVKDPYGELSVWEEPVQGQDYVIGADVAEGLDHGDNHCAWVLRRSTLSFVARIKSRRFDPDVFGLKVALLGWYYGGALVGIEHNGPGIAANAALKRIHYPRTWFDRDITRADEPLHQYQGWRTTAGSRRSILDRLEEEVRNATITMPADDFYSEARTFALVDGRPEAMIGKHDDEIMAVAITLQLHLRGGALRQGKAAKESLPVLDYHRPKAHDAAKRKKTSIHAYDYW